MNTKKCPPPLLVNLEQAHSPAAATEAGLSYWAGRAVPDGAEKELMFINQFIFNFRGSPDSFASYRKQLEKLLLWSWAVKGMPILGLSGLEVEEFIEFATNPPQAWTGKANLRRFTEDGPNPAWRPFVSRSARYQTSRSGVYSLFSTLGSFYKYALQSGLIGVNPVETIRQKSKYSTSVQKSQIRRFENVDVQIMFEVCRQRCMDDPQTWERALWALTLFLIAYLRVSETVENHRHRPMMKDIMQDRSGNCWIKVIGKGNKERTVSIPDEVKSALARYRAFLGESEFPLSDDAIPLIPSSRNKRQSISSTRQVRRIMQEIFDAAAPIVKERHGSAAADEFMKGTVHWLRHTGISEDVKYRPLKHVRDEAGHTSFATTERYVDATHKEVAQSRRQSMKHFGKDS